MFFWRTRSVKFKLLKTKDDKPSVATYSFDSAVSCDDHKDIAMGVRLRTRIAAIAIALGAEMIFLTPLWADENVGIGTTQPDSSAVLDVSIEALSRPRGLLIPRMTQQQRDAIMLPARHF